MIGSVETARSPRNVLCDGYRVGCVVVGVQDAGDRLAGAHLERQGGADELRVERHMDRRLRKSGSLHRS